MYKLIIADDEKIECLALERKILECFPKIDVLPGVFDGVSLIQQVEQKKPDIAIVDINMPGLNGLEAIDIIRMRKCDIKIIIHSAYSDFSYMKKAMQLGAIDYILKPAKKDTLIHAVRTALAQLEEENGKEKKHAENQKIIDHLQEIIKNEVMMSILLGSPDSKGFTAFQKSQRRTREEGVWLAMRAQSSNYSKEQILLLSERAMEQFCTSLICEYQNLFYFYLLPGSSVCFDNYQDWLAGVLDIVAQKLFTEMNLAVTWGCSSWKYQFDQTCEALRECRMALESIEFPSIQKIVFYQSVQKSRETNPFLDDFPSLIEARKENQQKFHEKWLEDHFAVIRSEKLSLSELQMWVMDFLMELHRHSSASRSVLQIHYDYIRYWKEIRQLEHQEEIFQWLNHVLKRESEISKLKKSSSHVENCVRFIEKNYQNDISLEEAAESCKISSFYMTRLLRQELDHTFIEILTDVRIKKAVALIKEGKLNNKEIGCAVGYPNTIYFYRVFKKSTGMTVGKMREFWEQEIE